MLVEVAPDDADERAERTVESEFVALLPRLDGSGAISGEYGPVGFATAVTAVETAADRTRVAGDAADRADADDASTGATADWRRRRGGAPRRRTAVDLRDLPQDGSRPTRPYSWRSASTGSSRPARRAGHTPKKTPTATETPRARATDQPVTIAGMGA